MPSLCPFPLLFPVFPTDQSLTSPQCPVSNFYTLPLFLIPSINSCVFCLSQTDCGPDRSLHHIVGSHLTGIWLAGHLFQLLSSQTKCTCPLSIYPLAQPPTGNTGIHCHWGYEKWQYLCPSVELARGHLQQHCLLLNSRKIASCPKSKEGKQVRVWFNKKISLGAEHVGQREEMMVKTSRSCVQRRKQIGFTQRIAPKKNKTKKKWGCVCSV